MAQNLSSLIKRGREYTCLGKYTDAEICLQNAYEVAKANDNFDLPKLWGSVL